MCIRDSPQHAIRFVGLNLANIRTASQVEQWASYFLNASNHADGCHDALDYVAFHSYPTNTGYTSNPETLTLLFEYYDSFVTEVNQIATLAHSLSPGTSTVLDLSLIHI
eukprot:TRINITY_DN31325_c0_g1_i1.p1 TRINITY_DN31325_c0_g1~~TRINITY_DN31325_c0_g1_i1.p1  ORF type:complete len:109 (-),score=25.50 TRINITY_DN31325_c0_g1_i1:68-394(-)